MEEKELLKEIKGLLEEQNRLIAGLKSQYEAMAAKNVQHMAKNNVRFWIMVAVVLLLLLVPNFTAT
jgi:hypothetical protein